VWFGGSYFYEEASVSQSLTIPVDNPTLRFNLTAGICGSPQDYLEVLIDDEQVWSIDGTSPLCGLPGRDIEVGIGGHNDDDAHILKFHCETFFADGLFSNFFVDVVELPGTPSLCEAVAAFIFADGFESGDTEEWSSHTP
jgi:hypothetical protein